MAGLKILLTHTSSDAVENMPGARIHSGWDLDCPALDYWSSSLFEAIDGRLGIRRALGDLSKFGLAVGIEGHRSPLRRCDGYNGCEFIAELRRSTLKHDLQYDFTMCWPERHN